MPNYDYHCTNCHHQMTAFQKMSDSALTTCPSCKTDSLKRGPGGGIGLQFKGSGFYITDYNSGQRAQEPTPNKSSSSCCPCGKNTSCDAQKNS